MRRALLLATFLVFLVAPVHGDDGSANVVQKFNGTDGNTSTTTFTVQDKWEIYWYSPRPTSITVLTADGTVVTGVNGLPPKGSLYVAKGGTYYIQLNTKFPQMRVPWQIVVAEVASGSSLASADVDRMFSNPGFGNYTPPDTVLQPGTVGPTPPSTSPTNPYSSPSGISSTTAPNPSLPAPPAIPPTPPPAPTTPPDSAVGKISEDQARAVVLIMGDNAEGTGFMIKTPDGPAIVTNIHVIADNPNLKVTTTTGALVPVLSEKGASDRDLALLAIKDAGYNYLDVATDISQTAQPGDEVITPGNSQGGEVMLNTAGKVLGIGPERIEFDNPIYHGNSGGPVFHTKTGKVLGVVTEAMKVDMSNDVDKASFASRSSAISGSMRYFGLRLDNVPSWIPIEPRRFLIETAFLDQFHKRSECLDCYLNAPDDNKPEDILWKQDEKILRANDEFFEQANGADTSQRLDADQVMWSEFADIAGIDLDKAEDANNFYSFDQKRASDEAAYRKALKSELDGINNDVSRLGGLPRTNSTQ